MKVPVEDIQIPFVCIDHITKIKVTPVDLVTCGTPLCEICNEEMSIEDYVIIPD